MIFGLLAALGIIGGASVVYGKDVASVILRESGQEPPYHVTGELVSVVIPTYMEQDYIIDTLNGIKNQTYDNIEVVISDASTELEDITLINSVADEYGCKIVRTAYSSISLGRNIGAEGSSGKILLFLDADCVMSQTFVEKMVDNLSREGIKLSHGMDVPYNTNDPFRIAVVVIGAGNKPSTYTTGRGVAIRATDFLEVGGYDVNHDPLKGHNLAGREDLDFGRRVSERWGRSSLYLDKTAYVAEACRRPWQITLHSDPTQPVWGDRGWRSGKAV